jgi:methylthioribose-1-phosphate isomerase
MLPTITWDNDKVVLIDQRLLPAEEVYIECQDYNQVAEAIEDMAIRGAPAIGVAAAYGVALGVLKVEETGDLENEFQLILARLKNTRPTARNLFWALEKMNQIFDNHKHLALPELKQKLIQEAIAIDKQDFETNKKIGFWGRELIQDGQNILTHCNAGALATAGYGTALGVIRAASEQGKEIRVFADETRPFLQGARLTCWELERDDVPVVLITDNMAGYLMRKGQISSVITGADRIARNGDTANKIGTYSVAVLAKENRLPFYVAAPLNTIDFKLEDGDSIPIEERNPEEVKNFAGHCITVPDIEVQNPAFDITPAKYITAIITEKGVAKPPFELSLVSFRDE